MGRKFQKKKKVEQLEIVPLDENPPLPSQRPSDEVVPKKVSTCDGNTQKAAFFIHIFCYLHRKNG